MIIWLSVVIKLQIDQERDTHYIPELLKIYESSALQLFMKLISKIVSK